MCMCVFLAAHFSATLLWKSYGCLQKGADMHEMCVWVEEREGGESGREKQETEKGNKYVEIKCTCLVCGHIPLTSSKLSKLSFSTMNFSVSVMFFSPEHCQKF